MCVCVCVSVSGVCETMPWPSFLSGLRNLKHRSELDVEKEIGRYDLHAVEASVFSISISSVEVNP